MAITKTVAGLYTTDGTTLTQVATTAELTSGLLDANNTRYDQALVPATTVLNPGQVYYVAILVDADTAGTTQGYVEPANIVSKVAADGPPPMYTLAGQTSLPETQAISGLTAAWDLVPKVGIVAA
jgi:hypothetical protein